MAPKKIGKAVNDNGGSRVSNLMTRVKNMKSFPVMIVFVLSYSLLVFGVGYVFSQKSMTSVQNGAVSPSSDLAVDLASGRSSRKNKANVISALNVSMLPNAYEGQLLNKVATVMEKRLEKALEGTFTVECKKLVHDTFEDYMLKTVGEEYLPYEQISLPNECRKTAKRENVSKIPAEEIRLLYLLLVHEQPDQVIRTMNALQEPQHHFVIHVDGKSQDTFNQLSKYAATKDNVHMLGSQYRMNVNWGGFNVVQGTLNGMFHALHDLKLPFDWLITVSGYTYPLMSNNDIRARLSTYPKDTNFFEISPQPNKPAPRTWHHFIECDNAMRRIWRLPELRNVQMYAGSQWFMASRAFVNYVSIAAGSGWSKEMIEAKGGRAVFKENFASKYAKYGKHTMIADENYFSTVLKASPFCNTLENNNQVHVQFDQYEHEKPTHKEGPSANKCLMPNPNHCGRSPTITTLDYLPVLDLGDKLFARKFVSKVDSRVLDAIDHLRSVDRLEGAVPPKALTGQAQLDSSATSSQDREALTNKLSKDCMDANTNCRNWAAHGECSKNPKYMLKHCALSCDVCPKAEETLEVEVSATANQQASSSLTTKPVKVETKPPNQLRNFVLAISLDEDKVSFSKEMKALPHGDGWENLYCLQGSRGGGAMSQQGSVKIVPCNPANEKGQIFNADTCSKDGELVHDKQTGTLLATRGTFNPPFCNVFAHENKGMCLDVEREQVKEGSTIITWPCHKTKWNQLFSFDGKGGIFINIPLIHHRDKLMCIEAQAASENKKASLPMKQQLALKDDMMVKLAPCDNSNEMQHFLFFDAATPPQSV